jgi:hypothetical protein
LRIRTLYLKVNDLKGASLFWGNLLQIKPHKCFDTWHEFRCENINLGLLLNDFGDVVQGSGCVPVFEFADAALPTYINRAIQLGATLILDGLEDPTIRSIVLRDPFGHEFELSKFHD